jgi:hypothetical protein
MRSFNQWYDNLKEPWRVLTMLVFLLWLPIFAISYAGPDPYLNWFYKIGGSASLALFLGARIIHLDPPQRRRTTSLNPPRDGEDPVNWQQDGF